MSAKSSSPTLLMKWTFAPRRAAATDWFDPFPPGPRRNSDPKTVSPQTGRDLVRKARSATKMPKMLMGFAVIFLLPEIIERSRRFDQTGQEYHLGSLSRGRDKSGVAAQCCAY